jgi:putative membrane protein insertion efficiency factor
MPKAPENLTRRMLWFMVRLYQRTLSVILPPSCRFYPTCSHYCLEALERHKLHRALWLTLKRLLRCHPWGGHGVDLVPDPPSDKHV